MLQIATPDIAQVRSILRRQRLLTGNHGVVRRRHTAQTERIWVETRQAHIRLSLRTDLPLYHAWISAPLQIEPHPRALPVFLTPIAVQDCHPRLTVLCRFYAPRDVLSNFRYALHSARSRFPEHTQRTRCVPILHRERIDLAVVRDRASAFFDAVGGNGNSEYNGRALVVRSQRKTASNYLPFNRKGQAQDLPLHYA